MDSLDFWLKAGKEMGFTGQSLDSYITAKMAIEEKKEQERLAREEKRLAREEKKEQERLAREEKKEQERLAREDKIEQERIAREDRVQAREVAFKMKEIELEQSRLELEAKKVELSKQKIDEGVLEYPSQEPNIRMPQIPPFSEQDDIAAYITRFESTATLCDWPVDSWATRLGLLLSGSALNVYSTLPSDVISSYSLLKKAILQAFKKTTHHYRSEFRHIKKLLIKITCNS
nr:GRB10-interacting GYF protein 2-like [Cherax quadricarinatus]